MHNEGVTNATIGLKNVNILLSSRNNPVALNPQTMNISCLPLPTPAELLPHLQWVENRLDATVAMNGVLAAHSQAERETAIEPYKVRMRPAVFASQL